MSKNDLTEVKGIGEKTADKIKSIGISTKEKLAGLTPEELAKKINIPKSKAKKFIKEAKSSISNMKEDNNSKKRNRVNEPKTGKGKEFDMSKIKKEIEKKLESGEIEDHEAEILEQRAPAKHATDQDKERKKLKGEERNAIKTGIVGLDKLFDDGIPEGNTIIMAGGAGSGKTILCLQMMAYHASHGEKCFYMSFEESEKRLKGHMKGFGWDPDKLMKSGNLKIKRYSPFDITRNVDAMLAKEKGELLINLDPVILPRDFKPDFVVLDSLTAVASAFTGKEDSYRIYIEQLFRFFEELGSTVFLITETKQIPKIFSTTGVEEFLADGVIVLYNFNRSGVREKAIEVLKMRGESHEKKMVAMQITNKGVVVYPDQEVFGGLE